MNKRELNQKDFRGIELCEATVKDLFKIAYTLTGNERAAQEIMFLSALRITDYNDIEDPDESLKARIEAHTYVMELVLEYKKELDEKNKH